MATDRLARTLAWWLRAAADPPPDSVRLRTEVIVPAPLDETFAFFSDARNLEALTPPWVNFRILTPMPVVMREGLHLDYRIVLHGVPIPWRSRIDVWEPGVGFVDRQVAGPYRWWRHEHRFEPVEGGTRVIDHVDYGPRARWISTPLVRRDVARIVAYRTEALGRRWPKSGRSAQYAAVSLMAASTSADPGRITSSRSGQ